MRNYGQYCPIARASAVLAERWTPIILRNLLNGCATFTDIADGAPGIPRSLLICRLRELERVGVVWSEANPSGRGSLFHLTEAGQDLKDLLYALGTWGERWLELAPEHVDPYVVLWAWCEWYLDRGRLPDRRVVVRFEFPDQPLSSRWFWVVFDGERSEVCRKDPGFEVDLVVVGRLRALIAVWMGDTTMSAVIRARELQIEGTRRLADAFPSWLRRSIFADVERPQTAPA